MVAIGFGCCIGIIYGLVYMIFAIIKTYTKSQYTVGGKIAIFTTNLILFCIIFFGGRAIEMSYGLIICELFAFGWITNLILLACVHPIEDGAQGEENDRKENKRGIIEWSENEEE